MLRGTVDNAAPKEMLETLLQNRLGLKYMQSKKLVASGREQLGMESSQPWTQELEAECLKLYEAEHGPIKEKDYSSPEPSKTVAADKPSDFTPSSSVPAGKPKTPEVKKVEEPPKKEVEPSPAKVEEEEEEGEPEKTPEEPKEAEETPEEKPVLEGKKDEIPADSRASTTVSSGDEGSVSGADSDDE
jgi:hypothetical protein